MIKAEGLVLPREPYKLEFFAYEVPGTAVIDVWGCSDVPPAIKRAHDWRPFRFLAVPLLVLGILRPYSRPGVEGFRPRWLESIVYARPFAAAAYEHWVRRGRPGYLAKFARATFE